MARGQSAVAYTLPRGGVCVAEKNKERKKNNVVEEFKIGNTRIKICDDYCYNRSDKDIEDILASIARKAQEHFSVAAEQ
ncbi:hypothetical protein [Defluviitalea phaphyphila]|uniref:hypothetical protein n=1 Tax=Defluviitalea phaphyphila TaxID=1473580 RepID=UPI000731380D|nr:hypothetical protein [Defluviitalea phaphyphila]